MISSRVSRSVHLLLLGVILGSATAYVWASVRAGTERALRAEEARQALVPNPADPHSEVTDQDMVAMFEEALAVNPTDRELLARYATFLFDLRRFADSARVFALILEQDGGDAETRTYMATALYAGGERERAMDEFEAALDSDPNQILALHNLALGHLDLNQDPDAAEEVVARIRRIDPAYEGIASLGQRIGALRAQGPE